MIEKIKGRLRPQGGFTLVEMLSAVAMSGIVLSTAGLVVVASLRVTTGLESRTGAAQSGRTSVTQIGQRMRSMTCLFAGEYAVNGGSPATTRAANILHASANRLIFIGDVDAVGGTTGSTGSVGFRPQLRWLEVSGAIGPTGSADIREGIRNPTNSARPFNYTITPATSLDQIATTASAGAVLPSSYRTMVSKVQLVPGYQRLFYYYNDAGNQVAESGGAVPLASLETITRIQVAFRVADRRPTLVTNPEAAVFINDYYVHAITDRCEGL